MPNDPALKEQAPLALIFVFYWYWININQKVWKRVLWSWRRPYFFDILSHFIWKVLLLCYFKYQKNWRKCQKIKIFSNDFALKDSSRILQKIWARCVIYITLQGWKQKSSERPMTCNLLLGPWHLPLISIFFFFLFNSQVIPNYHKKTTLKVFPTYSQVPIKRVGPNKRVGWNFIKYFCLSLCLFLSSCFFGAK